MLLCNFFQLKIVHHNYLENYSLIYHTSCPMSKIWIDYLDDVFKFYDNLNDKIKDKVIVRWRSASVENFQRQRWESKYPGIKIDMQSDFNSLLFKQKLCVSTYSGSNTYMTSLALNIPTIILFNKDFFRNFFIFIFVSFLIN